MKIGRLAAMAGAAAMAVSAFGARAASASTGPAAATGHSGGTTYINMHSGHTQSGYFAPSNFILLGGRPTIYTYPTEWQSWGRRSAVGFGPMWGVRNGHRKFVGQVVVRFSDRKSNAQFTATGKTLNYFENVRISRIRPGNGGSVQNWHWSWHAHNWVPRSRGR
jgi:hypothetical protein